MLKLAGKPTNVAIGMPRDHSELFLAADASPTEFSEQRVRAKFKRKTMGGGPSGKCWGWSRLGFVAPCRCSLSILFGPVGGLGEGQEQCLAVCNKQLDWKYTYRQI